MSVATSHTPCTCRLVTVIFFSMYSYCFTCFGKAKKLKIWKGYTAILLTGIGEKPSVCCCVKEWPECMAYLNLTASDFVYGGKITIAQYAIVNIIIRFKWGRSRRMTGEFQIEWGLSEKWLWWKFEQIKIRDEENRIFCTQLLVWNAL